MESGALKISFFGSESLLHRVVQERWNTRVFQRSFLYTLVAGLRETSKDLKLACGFLPLAPFFKTPQFYGVCCALTRTNAAARAVCPVRLDNLSSPTGQLWTSRRLEPSRATKSGGKAQGVGFQGPPEEATMAGQPFQEPLKGS